jgi:DNA-directed RNA polymerase specialized sigma24 family protein
LSRTPTNLESLHRFHPQVYRIAAALCATRSGAENVVEKVLLRSGLHSTRWSDDNDAQRWLVHYTVLISREYSAASLDQDILLNSATSPACAAVIAALRQLPRQQCEAYLLYYGEKFELRQLATAMDCSSAAAANHLSTAASTLNLLTANLLDEFNQALPLLMQMLVPPCEILELEIRQLLGRRRKWARVCWLLKLLALLLLVSFLLVAALTGWRMVRS